MKRNQSGFTLIEIAIVLVIIGLLLGGVLKGQELINSARVKNLAGDFKNIPVFIYGYQDKFKALPGDDIRAGSNVSATNSGDGDGIIEGAWNASTGESLNFWQHVRLAGLAPGPTNVSANDFAPLNSVGGRLGITNSGSTDNPISGVRGSYIVCSGSIAGKFAKQLDTTLDDSNTGNGSMRATAASGVLQTADSEITPAEDDVTYTVCMGF